MAHAIRAWLALLTLAGVQAGMARPWIDPAVYEEAGRRGQATVVIQLAAGSEGLERTEATRLGRAALARLSGPGMRVVRRFATIPFIVVELDWNALERLEGGADAWRVGPRRQVRGALTESAATLGATAAGEDFGWTGANALVALVDTGVDLAHPDLAGAVAGGIRFTDGATSDGTIQDDNGHGTHLAGILTGNGTAAPRGIAPDARLVVVKALDEDNVGFVTDVAAGLDWLVANRARFQGLRWINLSLTYAGLVPAVCPCDELYTDAASEALKAAIAAARAEGLICIGAAGNDGETAAIRAPACFEDVVAAGASFDTAFARAPDSGTYNDLDPTAVALFDIDAAARELTAFSNRRSGSPVDPCLDFVAPGYLIESTRLGGGSEARFGTSQAAAHLTAALALMHSAAPGLDGDELLEVLRETAVFTEDPRASGVLYRHVDLYAAIERVHPRAAMRWTLFE